jgi:predicted RNase H-like HicB family nuclease
MSLMVIETLSRSVREDRPLKLADHMAWVVVTPADGVPGEWLAHCLDLNVMSQGRSLSHALEMLSEAVGLVLDEDCTAHQNPFDRKAPQEDWDAFAEHMRTAELTSLEQLIPQADAGDLKWMATQLVIHLVFEQQPRTVGTVSQALVQHASAAA